MTDLGTADRDYVCGPDCKALRAVKTAPVTEENEESKAPWWEMALVIILGTVVVAFATVGALDVGIRAALDYWHF
jgi:hypothetical protein